MSNEMRIGVLTGGGDAPGLNPAIKGLVYRSSELGHKVIGLFDGWRSLLSPLPEVLPLDRETVRRWDRDGGTNLGSSRAQKSPSRRRRAGPITQSPGLTANRWINYKQVDFHRTAFQPSTKRSRQSEFDAPEGSQSRARQTWTTSSIAQMFNLSSSIP